MNLSMHKPILDKLGLQTSFSIESVTSATVFMKMILYNQIKNLNSLQIL